MKRAAVAYVASDELVKFGEGDILVTDASDAAIAGGQTDAELLAAAWKRGAALHSLPDLHAKVLVLDRVAVIGSANLSSASVSKLIEAAWVTDHPAAVAAACSLVEQLVGHAEAIDEAFIERTRKIPVTRRIIRAGKKPPARITLPTHRTWLVGLHELPRDYLDEANAIAEGTTAAEAGRTLKDSTVGWIRCTGRSRFRTEAQSGHTIIQVWRNTPTAKRPATVYRHAPILHKQDEESCTRFFVESFPDEEQTTLSWSQFQRLAKRVGLPGRIGPTSARRVSESHAAALFELWNG